MDNRPKSVTILGRPYSITYVDKPSEVDIFKRESCFGQVDFWTNTIRIYDNNRGDEDIFHTLLHEILHALAEGLKLKYLKDCNTQENHDLLELVAIGLADTLIRNEWITFQNKC